MRDTTKPDCFGRGDVFHPQYRAENDCPCCPLEAECRGVSRERPGPDAEASRYTKLLDEIARNPADCKAAHELTVAFERECLRRVSEIRRAAEHECKPIFDILADMAKRRMLSGPLCKPYNGYLVGVDPGRPGSDRTVKVRLESEDVE